MSSFGLAACAPGGVHMHALRLCSQMACVLRCLLCLALGQSLQGSDRGTTGMNAAKVQGRP